MKPLPKDTVFQNPAFAGHEQVVYCYDGSVGLKAIIAIHDTSLGPALGGARRWAYRDEAEALQDVLRLSRGMTYKNALAGINFGGGKAVIIAEPETQANPALFRAFGAHVEYLAGRYISAEDVGVRAANVEEMRKATAHVRGISEGGAGDPSPATAYGVFFGIKAAVRHAMGRHELTGISVCVQGLGAVGMALCELLNQEGAKLLVSDIRPSVVEVAVERFGAVEVPPENVHAAECDVFAPCALGAILSDATIPQIKARIVAGSANNQLADDRDALRLLECSITYAPDFVVNAGGVISIAHEGSDFDREAMMSDVARIGDTLEHIFTVAQRENLTTTAVAAQMAQQRIAAARASRP